MKYEQVWDGEWEPLYKDILMACCDCGLTHRIRIRVRKGVPQVQYTRDARRTGQIRRHHGITVSRREK